MGILHGLRAKLGPTPAFVHKILLEATHIHVQIVYACFHNTTAELSTRDRLYGPQSCNCSVSGPLQKTSAHSWKQGAGFPWWALSSNAVGPGPFHSDWFGSLPVSYCNQFGRLKLSRFRLESTVSLLHQEFPYTYSPKLKMKPGLCVHLLNSLKPIG